MCEPRSVGRTFLLTQNHLFMTHIEVLQNAIVEGYVIKLLPVQLERNIYLEVKKSLELIGGKWKSGKVQGFVFEQDPTELLALITGGGNCNLKKEFQFFATPDSIADHLVALADIRSTDKVLEPSAGRGAIVNAIHRRHPDIVVDGCELMDLNVTFLGKIPNFRLVGRDFLTDCNDKYNVIVANPPFSKNQDINHIMKMESLLYPGGRLVSIASVHWQFAGGKKEQLFKMWLENHNAEISPIDKGEFKETGTMVGACIIRIMK